MKEVSKKETVKGCSSNCRVTKSDVIAGLTRNLQQINGIAGQARNDESMKAGKQESTKHFSYFLTFLLSCFLLISCKEDAPDFDNSIFDTETPELNSFDRWLRQNFVTPYNIRLYYRLRDVETDFDYNVVPADIQKAKQMAYLLDYLWLAAYREVAADGIHFVRANAPRVIHLVGSPEWDRGTIRLGTAEGGLKITITDVNGLIPKEIVNQYYFNTIHHEFAHILHQTKDYPREFQTISVGNYMPAQWFNRSDEEAARLGFVSNYAGSQPQEDFVETFSRYVTMTEVQWNEKLLQAGTSGKDKILLKFGIVKKYMKDSWGVDVDELKKEIMIRANKIQDIDFDNMGF